MADLRDALAAALTDQYAEIWSDGGPWLTTAKTAGLLADHALADPAFRAALVEAVEEALPTMFGPLDSESRRRAADAIVARMLGDER